MTNHSFKFLGFWVLASLVSTASAEVLIKGTVDQSFERFDTKTAPGTFSGTDTVNRFGSTLANYNTLSFSGHEDLNAGLKATYELSMKYVGPDTEGRGPENYLSHVGLEGGFGKIKLGRQWRPMFTAIAATDPTQLSATPGFAGAGKGGTGLSGLAPEPKNNSITYSLPSFTPGLFIQLQHGFSDPDTITSTPRQGESQGAHVIFTDGQKFLITYVMNVEKMVKGSSFSASLTGTNGVNKDPVLGSFTLAQLTAAGQNGLPHVLFTSTSGSHTRESSGLAGSYDFGLVKLVGGHVTEKVQGTRAQLDLDVLGFKLPLLEKTTLGYLYSEARHTREAGSKFNLSGQKLLLTYDMSKRTTIYYAFGEQHLVGGTTSGHEFSSTINALGLRHSF